MSNISGQDTGSAVYCAGCNGCFQHPIVADCCPRCGAQVNSVFENPLSKSQLIREARGIRHRDDSSVDEEEEIERQIGKQLHVYELETLIGRGGMGRVYLARHRDLHRKCALKILSPRLSARDEDYVARFEHEGRAAAALNHPNVVTTHAIGNSNGLYFLEMEFVAGRSLQQLILDEGRLTPVRATSLAVAISEGLSSAHREGILHRDLKPDNVLLTHQGVPKLGDFGLAKRIVTDAGDSPERLVGTPNFMAPELLNGGSATPASDVYALGVCYFVLLTGRFPFVRGSVSQLKQAVAHDPLPNVRELNSHVSLEMAESLSLMLAKSPENRPADGIEAAQLLHAVLGHVRDLESLLKEAFVDTEGICWRRCDGRYRLELTLPDGRRQSLFVEESPHSATQRLLLLYSICCDADPAYFEEALRLNSEILHGGLAIREVDGRSMFVMVDTYPRGTVDAEEIRRSVIEIAFRADAVEKLLTGRDCH